MYQHIELSSVSPEVTVPVKIVNLKKKNECIIKANNLTANVRHFRSFTNLEQPTSQSLHQNSNSPSYKQLNCEDEIKNSTATNSALWS